MLQKAFMTYEIDDHGMVHLGNNDCIHVDALIEAFKAAGFLYEKDENMIKVTGFFVNEGTNEVVLKHALI